MKKILFFLLILVLLTGCYRNIPKTPPPLGTAMNANITINGNINLTGNLNYRAKQELQINPTALKVGPVNPPQEQIINLAPVFSFDRTKSEYAYSSFHVGYDQEVGTNISYDVVFYWAPNDNTIGTVRWCVNPLQTSPDTNDTINDAPLGPICINSQSQGIAYQVISAALEDIIIPQVNTTDLFTYSLYRDGANAADTYNDDAHLVEFTVRFYKNNLGEIDG